MEDFKYRVSIIVPVYNVEKYITQCLDSLLEQTIDPAEMEILCIIDGSPDRSQQICEEYSLMYPQIKVFAKENEGLSATRNFGIRRAKGKYMMFLDSDDMLTPKTVEAVTKFFDSVYDEVDEVAYVDQGYRYGKKLPLHFRYKYFTKTGIYDLKKFPYIMQTRVNVCVKNLGPDNFFFDETPGFRQEDQEYNCRVLQSKMKIGFCAEGEYQYNRSNETSIMATSYNAIEMFESCQKYFEELFARFETTVPKYYQAMYIHDLQWKVKSNILYPYHYDEEQYQVAINRIKALLDRVDDEVIASHPQIDSFHCAYWLSMKRNSSAVFFGNEKEVAIVSGKNVLYQRQKIELVLYRVRVDSGKIELLLSAKSPVFSFTGKPKVIGVTTKLGQEEECIIETFPSSFNYYHSKEKTNSFWSFYFEDTLQFLQEIRFYVEIDGIRYNTNYYFMDSCPYDLKLSMFSYLKDGYHVRFRSNVFYVENISEEEEYAIRIKQTELIAKLYPKAASLRRGLLTYKKTNPIWLYYDCKGVPFDNGYYQFVHDFKINDGVSRFYISAEPEETWDQIFTEEQIKCVITFGSRKHKTLYAYADKIITAYIEHVNVCPFDKQEYRYYKDFFIAEIIYLQHGILHASLPWKYSPERVNVNRVVVSSYFEVKNFTTKYGFRKKDLITAGMPRFEQIVTDATVKKNRILFAPTWRLYLISENPDGSRMPMVDRFMKSKYHQHINAFLNNPKLQKILEEKDFYLDFKVHPIFECYKECFTTAGDRITLSPPVVNDNDYAVFITDFSSYVFNFAYLKCPIIYFVPDMQEFKAGLNQYRELDLPFEDAFGDLTENEEELFESLKNIMENDVRPNQKYLERMESFFFPMSNCTDRIYKSIVGENQ